MQEEAKIQEERWEKRF